MSDLCVACRKPFGLEVTTWTTRDGWLVHYACRDKLWPCWIKCTPCDDYWCIRHHEHAHDCACPSIEIWADYGIDPYIEPRRVCSLGGGLS